jgi:coproporphyrinogen III oxidase-like Fe-S oxidoreductase
VHPGRADGTSAEPTARRWWNEPRVPPWERRVAAGERPVAGEESLGPLALATETLMLGLRTTAGVDLDDFTARYGVDLLATNDALVANLVREGRLEVHSGPKGRRLVPTVAGLAVADGLAVAFELPLPG